MKWLEIISIRSSESNTSDNQKTFHDLVQMAQKQWPETEVVLFQHSRLPSDFSILIHHRSELLDRRGSEFGIHLAWQLKEYGYLNHTVWLESIK